MKRGEIWSFVVKSKRNSKVYHLTEMASESSINIEKLKGSENYHTWRFAMENVLDFCGLDKCITNPCTETDEVKLRKAKARIVLSIDESLYVHIQTLSTAAQIWSALKELYDNRGLTRQIGLLRKLITIRLENCSSMANYVNEIIGTANKLKGVGFDITDEWIGAIILAGLTDKFKPFIMGIESSGVKINGDMIKSKLLDGNYSESAESALYSRNKNGSSKKGNQNHKKQLICYICNRKGHISTHCPEKGKVVGASKKLDKREPKVAFSGTYFSYSNKLNSMEWFIDSGATHHMTPNAKCLSQTSNSDVKEITAANNGKMKVTGVGNTCFPVDGVDVNVEKVLLVPELTANLLSVVQIVNKGNTVVFNRDGCSVYNENNELLVRADSSSGVYKLKSDHASSLVASDTSIDLVTWHRRLGHLNFNDIRKMNGQIVTGMNLSKTNSMSINCEVCAEGKQTRLPFKHVSKRAKNLLDLVHTDLCGPMDGINRWS